MENTKQYAPFARSFSLETLAGNVSWLSASLWGPFPRIAPLRQGAGAGHFEHGDWAVLLQRFAHDGLADYVNLARVRRLVEAYLGRIARAEPDDFADADDQLVFYVNSYNAIVVHQILLHYPVQSIRQIKGAFLRTYPVGRRNVSLHVMHSALLRSFGVPCMHAAICVGARGSAALRCFSGPNLQQQLDTAMRQLLADETRGARYDRVTNTLYISPQLWWFAGDFSRPNAMPGPWHLLRGTAQSAQFLSALTPYLPPALAAIRHRNPRLQSLPFDWRLNDKNTV